MSLCCGQNYLNGHISNPAVAATCCYFRCRIPVLFFASLFCYASLRPALCSRWGRRDLLPENALASGISYDDGGKHFLLRSRSASAWRSKRSAPRETVDISLPFIFISRAGTCATLSILNYGVAVSRRTAALLFESHIFYSGPFSCWARRNVIALPWRRRAAFFSAPGSLRICRFSTHSYARLVVSLYLRYPYSGVAAYQFLGGAGFGAGRGWAAIPDVTPPSRVY